MDLQKDVEALDRVLFRLASVDDERMLQVLQSLLPQLLSLFPRSLATPLELQLKDKILQVVSHIKTRLQALTRPVLPLDALCQVLQQSELSVFSYNLALLFIELGFEAASAEQRAAVLAAIAKELSTFSGAQQETFFRLLVRALPVTAAAIFPSRVGATGAEGDKQGQESGESLTGDVETVYESDANVEVVLDFLLDLVLYELPSSANADTTVYGLMMPRMERLQRVKVPELKREALYERQQHALKLVKEMGIPTRHKIPIYLAGSASFHHAVKGFSDEQLSRVLKYEEKEVEDADAMRRLMTLVLGSQVAQSSGAFEGSDAILLANRTRLADPSILQALTLLSASETATNVLPMMLQLLCQLMFGTEPSRPPNVDNKIKLATVRLCQWTFHHCQLALLEGLLGPVLFPTLLRLLMNPHTESEASSAEFVREFRQGIYESLSVLGTRAPSLVSASEQAFQVLLVRCLSEEEHRTGAGANAIKAFTSLAGAYAAAATPEVRTKVQDELVALLNGSKLFEPTKNYARVRTAIAAWCAELLTSMAAVNDGITMRFAVLRLGASPDEDTRRLSNKALFAQPLPSSSALAKSLEANFAQKDLKKSMHDVGAAESCVRFCVEIMKASQEKLISENVNDRRSIVEYILHTLLGPAEHNDSASAAATSVYETAASAVVEVCAFDPESVSAVLVHHVKELYDVAAVSQDRTFLLNIATIVMCTCSAGALSVSRVLSNFVEVGMNKLQSDSSSVEEQSGVLYILGSALGYVGCNAALVDAASQEEMQLLLSCFQRMSDLLESKVREGSNFASYPRSELAQNERVALLRSVMDGIGLAGTLTRCMQSSVATVASDWNRLKATTLDELKHVIEWKLKTVHFDEQLLPKLADKSFRASIVAKAGSQWMAEGYSNKAKLVPWLFLLKFHSNTKVAAVMGNLWEFAKGSTADAATTKEEKASLRQNWTLLFQFALARLENARNFKYREAACLALVDLLNGAEADNLRDDFLRLWKTASRAVDDVMEAVALSGVKLYRYLGELSLRVAANDAVCCSQLLEFLIEDGIVSKNTICRALSIDVLLRLVKTLKATDIQDRLAPLILKLLEYLSSMEMPELQYAQFHVEKKDQLERLRVSISQSGPVGQLLELTTARLKELAGSVGCVAVVTELVRGVANLLKFGVGLNTRVGTANFVVTLAGELPFELRKCSGAELLLRRVFIPYVSAKTAEENDQYGDEESRYSGASGGNSAEGASSTVTATSGLMDGLVIQSYCRAAAYLCPLVDAPTVRDYVRSGIFAFNAFNQPGNSKTPSPSSSPQSHSDDETMNDEAEDTRPKALQVYTSRFLLISALATMELVKKVPPIADADTVVGNDLRNTWYSTNVFPAAFIGQFAATDALKNSWVTVLDELPPTVLYSSSSLDAVLRAIALLLAHPAWDTRRQAARALQAIFASATYRSRLSTEQIAHIWQELIDSVPGRLWRGKGVILESIVALAAVKLETETAGGEWVQLMLPLLVDECARAWKNNDLAYLESAIINLGKFSALIPGEQCQLRASNVLSLRSALAEWIAQVETETQDSTTKVLPPLLIKCTFEALALMWPPATTEQAAINSGHADTASEAMVWLCASVVSPHLAAWSVRKAIFQALAAVADRAPVEALVGGKSSAVERIIETCCGPFGVADGKYSMVRVAAAGALVALLKRAADDSNVALRLVVQRERVAAAVQTLLASEEASEQQAAFNLKTQLGRNGSI
ncbi:hypothetical protein PF010_g15899 [Phytophthora fragariae]|uniref:Uncharacterized protein n=1 Tax=Phytophthora fragariae TaxID=53985 RepID=A0A6G0KT58_9STRA|nr:hypothetical protein PF010_g15899 [Phytophthora fragariae]